MPDGHMSAYFPMTSVITNPVNALRFFFVVVGGEWGILWNFRVIADTEHERIFGWMARSLSLNDDGMR